MGQGERDRSAASVEGLIGGTSTAGAAGVREGRYKLAGEVDERSLGVMRPHLLLLATLLALLLAAAYASPPSYFDDGKPPLVHYQQVIYIQLTNAPNQL